MSMKMYDTYGNVTMEVSSLERKGDDLVIKGKMLGTMPGTIYIRPEEVWNGVRLLSWRVIRHLPLYLFRAWRRRPHK